MCDSSVHLPVLCHELLTHLAIQPGETVVDCTTGLGGHARLFLQATGSDGRVIGLDADATNLERAKDRLAGEPGRWLANHANFHELDDVLDELGISAVDVIVADLGSSSNQLDDPQRGFSFQADGPLDMRYDVGLPTTAADLVNKLSESDLADLIYNNSQERFSRRIARRIREARRTRRITRTLELARLVSSALGVDPGSRKSKIHPATRTFLALRMAVNRELESLQALLDLAADRLAPNGRIGVISFHSVEDRIVKRDFLRRRAEGCYELVVRKPITPTTQEKQVNPRSRSAKLRVARRTSKTAESDCADMADTT